MSLSANAQRTPQLFVLSGLHEGAAVPLDANITYRIGSSLEGDIVLRDEGVVGHHATLSVTEGFAKLASHAEYVQADRNLQVPDGHVCESCLPLSFDLGNVHMCVAYERVPEQTLSRHVFSRMKVLLPVFVGLCCILSSLFFFPVGVASEPTPEKHSTRFDESAQKLPPNVVSRQLTEKLRASGLGSLQVQAGSSQLLVSGELPVGTAEQWHDVQVWFDREYGKDYLLRAKLTQAHAAQVAIQAVWLGPSPYVVDGQGQRRYPGAVMDAGWVLEKIGPHEVVLVKNGQQHIFHL